MAGSVSIQHFKLLLGLYGSCIVFHQHQHTWSVGEVFLALLDNFTVL